MQVQLQYCIIIAAAAAAVAQGAKGSNKNY